MKNPSATNDRDLPRMVRAALHYVARGWAVLPLYAITKEGQCACHQAECGSAGKHPMNAGGVKNATLASNQVWEWWSAWPDANIGVATGTISGLAVLDIDPRHGGSVKGLGNQLTPLRVATGGGGLHLYFALPAGGEAVRNSVGRLGPGMDLRGENGYVVAPPSMHASGTAYRWANYTQEAPPPLPHRFLLDHPQNRAHAAPRVAEVTPDAVEGTRIPSGQRNQTLASLAGTLRHVGLTPRELEAALVAINAERCAPPLPVEEVRRICASISRYSPGPGPATPTPAEAPFAASALLREPLAAIPWVITSLLPTGLSLLAGKPKLGKSWMALHFALCCAAGTQALGAYEVSQGETLYLALEDTRHRLQTRIRLLLGEDDPPEGFFLQVHWPRWDEGGAPALAAWLRDHPRCHLVIIDTLAKVKPRARSNGSAYEEEYAAIAALKELADEFHIALLLVHHLRKMEAEDPVDQISGTTGLTGAADGYLILQRPRGTSTATLHLAGRDVEERGLALAFNSRRGTWRITAGAPKPPTPLLTLLRSAKVPLSTAQIAKALGKSLEATRLQLRRAVRRGEVQSPAPGQWGLPPQAA